MGSVVDRLNARGDQRLSAMWELVMLDAMSRVGKLRHEVPLANGSRPDFELTTEADGGRELLVVGDITAVSDAWLDEQNPVNVLFEEVGRLARKYGLDPSRFGYHVTGDRVGSCGKQRMSLTLPPKGELLSLVKRVIEPWVNVIKTDSENRHRLEHVDGATQFVLAYDPMQECASGSYTSYDVAVSLTKNPIFSALKRKVDQLKHAPAGALRLIVACDGDCALFRPTLHNAAGTYSARQIAQDFLRQHRSIDAVLLVGIDEQRSPFWAKANYKVRYDLLVAPVEAKPTRLDGNAVASLEKVLRVVADHVPRPVQSVYNAVLRCRELGFGHGMFGAYKMNDNSVRLSSRAVQKLLAGETTPDEFFLLHGWDSKSGPSNPFLQAIRRGRMISAAKIEPGGDNDDDWFVFTFGRPDPAISQFVVPEASSDEGSNPLEKFWRFLRSWRSGQQARSRMASHERNGGRI